MPPRPARSNESAADVEFSGLPERSTERYQLGEVHGQGGLGRVLLAYDRDLERPIAIKELLSPNSRAEARFVREAKITARLEHPAIVPVHDAGRRPSGEFFYTMKLVAGRSLKEILAEQTTLEGRLAILPNVLAVVDAVAYAHSKQIIHRDLKPANIIVGEFGETVVIDWGLAKDLSAADDPAEPFAGPYRSGVGDEVTVLGEVLGTPAYMSPEQARGESVGIACDVYALGAILYEVVSGRRPYDEVVTGSVEELIETIRARPPAPLRSRGDDRYPDDLIAIVERAVAREPHHRYASTLELAEDLRRYLAGRPVRAYRYSALGLARKWIARHKGVVTAICLAVVILLAFGITSIVEVVSARDRALRAQARAVDALHRAEAERMIAKARGDEMILANARAWLDRDPTRTLAWLKQYPETGADQGAARSIALQAAHTGAARWTFKREKRAVGVGASIDGRFWAAVGIGGNVELYDSQRDRYIFVETGARYFREVAALEDGRLVASGGGDVYAIEPRTETARHLTKQVDSTFIAIAPDGSRLAALRDAATITVLDLNGEVLHELPTAHPGVYDFEFVGRDTLVSGSESSSDLYVYDLVRGRHQVLRGHRAPVSEMAAVGEVLATAAEDGSVVLWEGVAFGTRKEISDDGEPVLFMAFTPDGHLLAGARRDGTIFVWNRQTKSNQKLRTGLGAIGNLAFSPNGEWLVAADESGKIVLWAFQTGQIERRHGHRTQIDGLWADDQFFATADASGEWRIWPYPANGGLARQTGVRDAHDLAVLPGGRAVVIGDEKGTVSIWGDDGHQIARVVAEKGERVNRVYPWDERVTVFTENAIGVWSPPTWNAFVYRPETALAAGPSHDGRFFAIADENGPGALALWDLTTLNEKRLGITGGGGVREVRVLPGAKRVLAVTLTSNGLQLWDAATGASREVAQHTGAVKTIAVFDDGGFLSAGVGDEAIYCADAPLDEVACQVFPMAHSVWRSLVIDQDGVVAVCQENGEVVALDVRTGQRSVLFDVAPYAKRLELSIDGRFLAAATDSNDDITIYDISSGLTASLAGHRAGVDIIRFADSGQLVSIGGDGVVRWWDVPTEVFPPPSYVAMQHWLAEQTAVEISKENQLVVPHSAALGNDRLD